MSKLPDFIIIGASRSGTSSLFKSLLQHPDLSGPVLGNRKEMHFFDNRYERGLDWYKSLFRGKKYHIEATPNYLFDKQCPKRIAKDLPDCRFIAMLRNPVNRAYSHYANWKKKGNWTEKNLKNPNHLVIQKGVYLNQLQRWYYFINKKRILIIRSEDFYAEPEKVIKDTLSWMGLESIDLKSLYWDPRNEEQKNPNKKNQVIPKGLEIWLKKFYKIYNNRLYQYLERDMGW